MEEVEILLKSSIADTENTSCVQGRMLHLLSNSHQKIQTKKSYSTSHFVFIYSQQKCNRIAPVSQMYNSLDFLWALFAVSTQWVQNVSCGKKRRGNWVKTGQSTHECNNVSPQNTSIQKSTHSSATVQRPCALQSAPTIWRCCSSCWRWNRRKTDMKSG